MREITPRFILLLTAAWLLFVTVPVDLHAGSFDNRAEITVGSESANTHTVLSRHGRTTVAQALDRPSEPVETTPGAAEKPIAPPPPGPEEEPMNMEEAPPSMPREQAVPAMPREETQHERLVRLKRQMIREAVRYARSGMFDPRAYDQAYKAYHDFENEYYSDTGEGGKALHAWLSRINIYAGEPGSPGVPRDAGPADPQLDAIPLPPGLQPPQTAPPALDEPGMPTPSPMEEPGMPPVISGPAAPEGGEGKPEPQAEPKKPEPGTPEAESVPEG